MLSKPCVWSSFMCILLLAYSQGEDTYDSYGIWACRTCMKRNGIGLLSEGIDFILHWGALILSSTSSIPITPESYEIDLKTVDKGRYDRMFLQARWIKLRTIPRRVGASAIGATAVPPGVASAGMDSGRWFSVPGSDRQGGAGARFPVDSTCPVS